MRGDEVKVRVRHSSRQCTLTSHNLMFETFNIDTLSFFILGYIRLLCAKRKEPVLFLVSLHLVPCARLAELVIAGLPIIVKDGRAGHPHEAKAYE